VIFGNFRALQWMVIVEPSMPDTPAAVEQQLNPVIISPSMMRRRPWHEEAYCSC